MAGWYEGFAAALARRSDVPAPLEDDELADDRLVAAVRRDLRGEDGRASAVAVRIIWTGDHLDAARRLQASLVGPAQAVAETALDPLAGLLPWSGQPARA